MKKQKIYIERDVNCKSENIIWRIISTDGGLQKWLADNVQERDGQFTFTWGEEWGNHEQRTATVVSMKKNKYIRMRWDDETDPEAYLELAMSKNDITGDFVLHITDFAAEDDVDSLMSIWDQNFEELHRNSGL